MELNSLLLEQKCPKILVVGAGISGRACAEWLGTFDCDIDLVDSRKIELKKNLPNNVTFFPGFNFSKINLKNEEIMEMMSIKEDDPSGHLIGPEVYRTIFGQPSGDHNILLIREYDVDRKYIPQTIELLNEVEEIGKDEDTKVLALYPIIADKMDSLFVVYYYSSGV